MTYFSEIVIRRAASACLVVALAAAPAWVLRADTPDSSTDAAAASPRCGDALALANARDDDDGSWKKDKEAGEGRGGRKYGAEHSPRSAFDPNWTYGRSYADARPVRPQEWAEAQAFMQKYAPVRQAALDRMPEGNTKESIKRFVAARFRSLKTLERRDPAGFQQRLAQLKVEDDIFGLVSNWGGSTSPDQQQKLREALQARVARLVELDLQERQRRVEALKAEMAEQSELLEKDLARRDALVEGRVSKFVQWANEWAARRKDGESETQLNPGESPRQNGEAAGGGDDPDDQPRRTKKNPE